MENNNYLINTWQAFIQQIIHNASHGYYFYNYYVLAESRRKNLPKIDQTITARFDAGKSKDKRYHHKKAGLANYKFLRYELMLIILKTSGFPAEALGNPASFTSTTPRGGRFAE